MSPTSHEEPRHEPEGKQQPMPHDVTSQGGAGRMYARLPVLILAITVMALALGTLALRNLETQLVATKGESLALAAISAVETLDRLLEERNGDVQLMAQIVEFRNFDPRTLTPYLQKIHAVYPIYIWLGMTDRQGRILAATTPASVGLDRSQQPWFQAARTNQTLSVTDAAPSQEMDGTLAITLSAPFRDSTGAFAGTVMGQVGLPLIETILAKEALLLQAQAGDMQRLEWQLLNRTGDVLIDSHLRQENRANLQELHVPSVALAASTTGYIREHHPRRDVDVLTGYAKTKGTANAPGLEWTVLVRLDHDVIVAPIRVLMWKLNAAGMLMVGPLVGLLLWSTRHLKNEYARSQADLLKRTQTERKFRGLLEATPDAIIIADDQGRILLVNQRTDTLFGYTREELVGQHVESLLPAQIREAHIQQRAGYSVNPQPLEMGTNRELLVRRKDGSEFSVEISLSPLQTEEGLLTIASVHDVTERKQTEEAQARLAKRLEVATRAAQLGVWDWNIPKNELTWDDRMFALYGVKKEDFSGAYEAWLSGVHPEDRAQCDAAIQQALRDEHPYDIEFRIRWPDGTTRIIAASGQVMWDAQGNPLRITGTNADITERKQTEQALARSEERFRLITRATTDVLWDWNLTTNGVWWSDGMLNAFGYEPKTIEPGIESWLTRMHPDDSARVLANVHEVIERGSDVWSSEYRFRHGNGSYVDVLHRAFVVRNEQGIAVRMVGALLDITARKQAEEALKQATAEAESATQAKSEFLATMSHEIRTPMNAIIGMGDLLIETSLTKIQEDYVQRLSRAANALLELIDNILDLSKVESGKLELESVAFDLPDLIERIAELLAVRAHAKNIDLISFVHPDVPETVMGDPTRLRQVLINLVGNAIKFTEQGEVVIRVKPDKSGLLRISVSDTGIGIAQDKLGSVFEIFSQADSSTTRKYGGTGLGLSISKRLVELMGGRLEITSKVGTGSTFYFTLPFKTAEPSEMSQAPRLPSLQGLPILLVDDNETNRLILREIIGQAGASIAEAPDGPSALAMMMNARTEGAPFKLIILDCRMPDMDGFQVVEAMRKIPDLMGTSVLMLTSDMRRGDASRAHELGIKNYVSKPVRRMVLFDAIAEAIGTQPAEALDRPLLASPRPYPLRTTKPLRILVAEDLEDNRDIIALFLKETPCVPEFVENGAEAVQKYTTGGDYDLVLMDVQMPVMDGYQATRAIRQWERDHQRTPTPIAALTANAFHEEAAKSLEAGCTVHLTKPIKKRILLDAIRQYAKPAPTKETTS